jgi:hypothetical protein
MKKKKLILLVLISILSVCLTSCIIIPLRRHYTYSADEVSCIRFYDLRDSYSRTSGFDEEETAIFTLPDEQMKEFLTDFSKITFKDSIIIVLAAVDPSFCYGPWVVEIVFTDGSYSFYSTGGFGETFDANGECIRTSHYSADDEDLEKLIGKYYEQID